MQYQHPELPPDQYRLLSFQRDTVRAGLLIGRTVFDLAHVAGRASWATVREVLEDWELADAFCTSFVQEGMHKKSAGQSLSECTLVAPLQYPGAIYCAGANYTDHVEEMARARGKESGPTMKEQGERPWHFIKASRAAIVGPGARVKAPRDSSQLDWEIELAVVIGHECRNVSAKDFARVVCGYMVANDLSARDLGRRSKLEPGALMHLDWIGHKTFDGSCPTGPWITPSRYINDPNALCMKLWVNDKLMQDSNTSNQIFNVGEQIEALSAQVTLFPGDLVLTGTPAGVGAGRNHFLQPGDEVTLGIQDLGEFSHLIG